MTQKVLLLFNSFANLVYFLGPACVCFLVIRFPSRPRHGYNLVCVVLRFIFPIGKHYANQVIPMPFLCHFRSIFMSFLEHVWVIFGTCLGHFRNTFGAFQERFWSIFGTFSEHFWVVFFVIFVTFSGHFRNISGTFCL